MTSIDDMVSRLCNGLPVGCQVRITLEFQGLSVELLRQGEYGPVALRPPVEGPNEESVEACLDRLMDEAMERDWP